MEPSSESIFALLCHKPSPTNSKELSGAIHLLFGNPKLLLERVRRLTDPNNPTPTTESGLDLTMLSKLYSNISELGRDVEISFCLNKAFEQMEEEGGLKAFAKSTHEMKYFLIVLLWPKLFLAEENKITLFRALKLLDSAHSYDRLLTEWLKDVSANDLIMMISRVHEYLANEFDRLVEEGVQDRILKNIKTNINSMCNLLRLLYASNREKPRFAKTVFISKAISHYFDPIEQFKRYLHKETECNFSLYPFLLDFDYKYKLIQIESVYEQNLSIKKSMHNEFTEMLHMAHLNGNFSMEGLIYLCFAVRRENILDDSMEKLGKIKSNLKSPLRIEFIGEEGTDEGGVKNEYFQLVTKAIFNPYLDMFLPKNNGRFYWFNGYSFELPLRFEFVGMLLALSIYNSVHLDIRFPDIIYKKLLKHDDNYGIEIIEDLKEIEPEIYKSLKHIMTTEEPLEPMELYFNIEYDHFGEKEICELVEDGNNIHLCQENKEYYCLSYADYILNKHIERQFTPFRKGFYRVVSGGIIEVSLYFMEIFDPEELRILVGGIEEIDMEELRKYTHYEGGYTEDTPIIKHLWELLKSLEEEEKKAFLFFVTGTDRVPIDGLKSLNFLIQRHSNINHLPTAHTCFNVFLLPEYETKQQLEHNLKLILKNNQGFGLI